jgi:hypothetical protein
MYLIKFTREKGCLVGPVIDESVNGFSFICFFPYDLSISIENIGHFFNENLFFMFGD